jgi:hypothetical protein
MVASKSRFAKLAGQVGKRLLPGAAGNRQPTATALIRKKEKKV